ncbi:MAG: hypothetical protein ACREK1_07330 [Longimicrobiales bacterium]
MEQPGAPPGDVIRDTMPRFLMLRVLFTFALLSGGMTSAVHASHEEQTVDAELVSSTGDISGAALPASGLTSLATLVELDGRAGRPGGEASGG